MCAKSRAGAASHGTTAAARRVTAGRASGRASGTAGTAGASDAPKGKAGAGRGDGKAEQARRLGGKAPLGPGALLEGDGGAGGKGASPGVGGESAGEPGRLDAGLSQAAEKPPIADPLAEGPTPGKRRSGERGPDKGPRKTKAEREQEERKRDKADLEVTAKMWAGDIQDVVGLPFEAIAARRGAHWKLTDEEKARFALALSRVGAKHFPALLDRFGEELSLAICFGALLYGRIKADAAIIARAKLADTKGAEGDPGAKS